MEQNINIDQRTLLMRILIESLEDKTIVGGSFENNDQTGEINIQIKFKPKGEMKNV